MYEMEIEKPTVPHGSVSGHTQHLLPYVLSTKEVVTIAR
jgi:hypothetical protein